MTILPVTHWPLSDVIAGELDAKGFRVQGSGKREDGIY
jgi:hypothetical protein